MVIIGQEEYSADFSAEYSFNQKRENDILESLLKQ
jgi:hypothetical protein